jgi:hypothetical protein
MDWLRRLFGSDRATPRYGREAEPVPIDWKPVEDTLVELVGESLSAHVEAHPGVAWSALCLDCNAERAEVLVSLDAGPAPEPGDEREWDVGAWEHHGINLDRAAWLERWAPVEQAMTDAVGSLLNHGRARELPALREEFLVMACRALLRVEHGASLSGRKAPGFAVLCMDHDEGPREALARRDRVVHGSTRGGR